MSSKTSSPFQPLRHRAFRIIWTSTLIANLGTLVQSVGAGWMMAELTPSHNMIALVQASTTLPIMLLAIPSGALADSVNRRKVMLVSQSFMAIVSAMLAVAAWFGVLAPWTLLAFTFALGLGAAVHLPSWQASMRDLVPREDLASAITLNGMSFNMMRSIGPAFGGLLVASAGPAAAFALNAVSYIALIYALYTWRPNYEERTLPAESLGSAMAAGLRYVTLSPNLMRVMGRGFVFGIAAVAVMALLPVITRDILQAQAQTYGVLLGVFGFGAILGGLSSPWLRRWMGIEAIVAASFLGFAITAVTVALSHSLWLTIPALVLGGATWVLALSLFNVSTQLATPRWVVGRVLAIYQTCTFGGMAIGSWLWGWVSEGFGAPVALFGAAIVMVLGALMGQLWRMPDFNQIDLDPANRFHAPALRLNLKARSGPILIMIDWEIAEENTEAFMAAMAARRRVRLRDGARDWSLLRDLEHPNIWVESYHVPTWTDYIRHNQRRTKADAENFDLLLQLHVGDEPPHVHRMIERHAVTGHDDMPIIERPKTM